MQYGQRKLQRSVTEMRRSRSGLPSRSVGFTYERVAPACSKPFRTRYLRRTRRYHRSTTPYATAPRASAVPGTGMSRAPRPRGSSSEMSNEQKRGFRLPWAADRAPGDGAAGAATLDPAHSDSTNGTGSDELGEGPFGLAGGSPRSTTDPAPAEPDVQEASAEATMSEGEPTQSPAREAQREAAEGGGWPDVDSRTAPQHAGDAERAAARPAIHASGESRIPRRENPLVAGLVKAMREAAVASRDETMTRLHADAEARVATIRGSATTEAAELKHRAENDISEIRDW